MLNADQRAAFDAKGLVKLPAAISPDDASQMCDEVWALLALKHGIKRDDPSTWTTERPTGFNRLSRTGALDQLWSPEVCAAISELLGTEAQHHERPRVLMTFPEPGTTWDVPRDTWHFDFTPLSEGVGIRAVQVFALLTEVGPQGGGTVVLTGSHELVRRYVLRTGLEPKPKMVRADLSAQFPRLADLWGVGPEQKGDSDQRAGRLLGVPFLVDRMELCLTEVTGKPGDVYIMNSDCFHAIAPNALTVARVMCTSLVTRA